MIITRELSTYVILEFFHNERGLCQVAPTVCDTMFSQTHTHAHTNTHKHENIHTHKHTGVKHKAIIHFRLSLHH